MSVGSCTSNCFHGHLAGRVDPQEVNAARAANSAADFAGALDNAARLDASTPANNEQGKDDGELRKAFESFVGESFYGQLFQAMRKTVGKPAYFHGGRAEETFQAQLDQLLTEKMSQCGTGGFSDSMYELYRLQQQR